MKWLPIGLCVALLFLVSPVASAVYVGEGVRFEWATATLTMGSDMEFASPVTFVGDAISLDGYTWTVTRHDEGSSDWTLEAYEPTALVRVSATMPANGTMTFGNFTGTLFVSGVPGLGTFEVTGPNATWSIPAGEMTVTIASAVASTVQVETAFDTWIPLVVWGALVGLFLYFTAWLPAIASMMALGASLTDPALWPTAASVMLVVIALTLHVLATTGIVPQPWSKRSR